MSQFRLVRLSLLLASLGLTAVPALLPAAYAQAPAAPAADPAKNVRPELFKLLEPGAFKQLMDAKKFPELQQKIAAAEAVPNRTPYENYSIDRMKLAVASVSNNDAMILTTLESVLATPFLTPKERDDFTQVLAGKYYEAKNYAKAIEVSKRYQKESTTPEKLTAVLTRSYYLSGDYASAKTELAPLVAAAETKGLTPSKEDLGLLATSAIKVKDDATYIATMEKMVKFYPTDEYWTDLLNRMQRKPKWNDRFRIDVLRLEDMAIKTLDPLQYEELAELSLRAGLPAEAKKAMDEGYAAGVMGKGNSAAAHKQLRDKATKQAADDVRSIASGEAAAMKSKDGTGLVNLGYAYVTMDQFDKGIALMEQGIAKGGMKRADEAKLRLAIAYAKAGRKADAVKAFEALKGDDGLSDLARYWIMYVNSTTAPAAAAPAPAPVK